MTAMIGVISKPGCPYCSLVRSALTLAGLPFVTIELKTEEGRAVFKEANGVSTFPQVFRSGERIGGYEETAAYLERLAALGV